MAMSDGPLRHENHQVDLCVVGGGMSGLAAALAAARHGATVALVHDRPVLGGNASSEVHINICGADRHGHIPHLRETGILEELRFENLFRNPNANYTLRRRSPGAQYSSHVELLLSACGNGRATHRVRHRLAVNHLHLSHNHILSPYPTF